MRFAPGAFGVSRGGRGVGGGVGGGCWWPGRGGPGTCPAGEARRRWRCSNPKGRRPSAPCGTGGVSDVAMHFSALEQDLQSWVSHPDESLAHEAWRVWFHSAHSLLLHERPTPIMPLGLARLLYLVYSATKISEESRNIVTKLLLESSFQQDWYIASKSTAAFSFWEARELANIIYALTAILGPPNTSYFLEDPWFTQRWALAFDARTNFRPQELVNILQAWARVGTTAPFETDIVHPLHHWLTIAELELPKFTCQGLALTLYSLGKLRAKVGWAFLRAWLNSSMRVVPMFSPIDLNNALYGLSRIEFVRASEDDPTLLSRFEDFVYLWIDVAIAKMNLFKAGEFASSLYSLSRIVHDNSDPRGRTAPGSLVIEAAPGISTRLFANVQRFLYNWMMSATKDMVSFNAQDYTTMLYSLKLLRVAYPPPDFVEKWYDGAKTLLHDDGLNKQELCIMLKAVAGLNIREDLSFLKLWSMRAEQRADEFCQQELVQTIGAFATMRHRPMPMLWSAWQTRVISTIADMKFYELAQIIRSLGQLRLRPSPDLMGHWYKRCCHEMENTEQSDQALSQSIFGLMLLGIRPPKRFLDCWFQSCSVSLDHFGPQAMANSLHALSKLRMKLPYNERSCWMRAVSRIAPVMGPSELTSSVYSLARMKCKLRRTEMAALGDIVELTITSYKSQHLSNVLFGFAKLGFQPPDTFFDAWLRQAFLEITLFEDITIAQTVWAFAKLERTLEGPFADLMWFALEEKITQLSTGCTVLVLNSLALKPDVGVPRPLQFLISNRAISLKKTITRTQEKKLLGYAHKNFEACCGVT